MYMFRGARGWNGTLKACPCRPRIGVFFSSRSSRWAQVVSPLWRVKAI